MSLLNIATVVCVGLLIGTEFAVSAFVNPVLWRLEDSAQATAISMFARRLGTAMPFWYVLSLLLLVCESILQRHTSRAAMLFVATGLWAAVIVLTLLFLVPINNRMARLTPHASGPQFRMEHEKWDALHRVRVAALAASFVCFLAASGR